MIFYSNYETPFFRSDIWRLCVVLDLENLSVDREGAKTKTTMGIKKEV